jgi:glycosyltransferase involved in cell wall biosynthesis
LKVFIYQRVLPHYRIPFFDALAENLSKGGVKLTVIAGNEYPGTVPKTLHVERNWVEYRRNRYINLFGREAVIQAVRFRDFTSADAVIVEQSNRLLVNYLFIGIRYCGLFRLGLWGHGKNFQSGRPSGFLEGFKRRISKVYDWWFCYTARGKQLLTNAGCDESSITVVRNSIEINDFDGLSEFAGKDLIIDSVAFCDSDKVGIYCGGMYREKRLGFLIEAIDKIKCANPGFKMIFIGEGPDAGMVREFVSCNPEWAVYVGAVSGPERAKYFAAAKVFLMPGLVGLAVLDSFASCVPMITTEYELHSPEIDYLQSGVNGLMSENNVESYVDAVCSVLNDSELYGCLVSGCLVSSEEYSIDNMASNYAAGVLGLLRLT